MLYVVDYETVYKELESAGETVDLVEKRYKQLTLKYHPDKINESEYASNDNFKTLRQAYQAILRKLKGEGEDLDFIVDLGEKEQLEKIEKVNNETEVKLKNAEQFAADLEKRLNSLETQTADRLPPSTFQVNNPSPLPTDTDNNGFFSTLFNSFSKLFPSMPRGDRPPPKI